MSLGKAKTRIKSGVGQLQSVSGIKRTIMHLGIGIAIGALVDLILNFITETIVIPALKSDKDPTGRESIKIYGFGIFPDHVNAEGTPFIVYDDLLLLIATVALLFTRKFWIVIGFGLGWYFSTYFGLYTALGLPAESLEEWLAP